MRILSRKQLKNLICYDLCLWFKTSIVLKIVVAVIVAAYLIFIRPFIMSIFSTAYLIEWLIICVASWQILAAVKNTLKNKHSGPIKESPWHKHVQRVEDRPDEDIHNLALLQSGYIEGGLRLHLLTYLKQTLINSGLNEDDSIKKLHRLIDYNDKIIPWYAFGIWRRRIQQQNTRNRQHCLNDIMNDLKILSKPTFHKFSGENDAGNSIKRS